MGSVRDPAKPVWKGCERIAGCCSKSDKRVPPTPTSDACMCCVLRCRAPPLNARGNSLPKKLIPSLAENYWKRSCSASSHAFSGCAYNPAPLGCAYKPPPAIPTKLIGLRYFPTFLSLFCPWLPSYELQHPLFCFFGATTGKTPVDAS